MRAQPTLGLFPIRKSRDNPVTESWFATLGIELIEDADLAHASGGETRDLRVHRGVVLQLPAQAFQPGVPLTPAEFGKRALGSVARGAFQAA